MWWFVPRRAYAYIASGAAFLLVTAAGAQAVDPLAMPGELDPASPMEAMPDLGVDWPDLAAPDDLPEAPASEDAGFDTAASQRYSWAIRGVEEVRPADIAAEFAKLLTLAAGAGDPANVAQIDRRAREDERLLTELLRRHGYYDARVEAKVSLDRQANRVAVALEAEPGALYTFSAVELPGIEAAGAKADELRRAFPIAVKDPVDAGRVEAAEAGLRTALGREGFAFGELEEPEIVVDHDSATATLTARIDTGSSKRFGAIRVEGDPLFGPRHLGRIARFRPGDPFDAARLEDFRRALIQTGLISTIQIRPVPSATDDQVVDIAVRLEPAPPRTIAGELGYGTGEGVRAEVSWTHRNLIRPEGAVTFRGVVGTREQLVSATIRRNNYKGRDRVLTGQVAAAHVDRNAYDAKTFALIGSYERQTNIIWQKNWTWSIGGELIASDERDTIRATGEARRRTFFILALPGSLAYDGSDDLLNPTTGFRLSGRLSPEASLQDGSFYYAKAQIDGSVYQPVSRRVVLAGRVRLGSIAGASRDRIAPSRRFYAGGGSSVRGYGYQDIGPVDIDNDPIGGRSLAEFAVEARVRFGNFGIVPFLDAGNLYTSELPKFTGLRYGAGIGGRYYTGFGPIRVDVGTPINRRRGDARIAVYVSLGQAF